MKAFTDLEQSKKLSEILPLDSADMYYYYTEEELTLKGLLEAYYVHIPFNKANYEWYKSTKDSYIPCWSLAALLEVLPKETNVSTPKPLNESSYCCWNQQEEIFADNPVDACVEMIIRLHKQKLL